MPSLSTSRSYNPTIRWDPVVEAYLSACLGPARLRAVSAALARPSLTPTLRVNTLKARPLDVVRKLRELQHIQRSEMDTSSAVPEGGRPSNQTGDTSSQAYSDRERNDGLGAQELAEGRLPGTGYTVAGGSCRAAPGGGAPLRPPPPPRLHPRVPGAVVLSGRGPCDLSYEAGLPEAVVNRFAAEAVLKGAHVYAAGLLAASPGIAPGDLVAVSAALERPAGHLSSAASDRETTAIDGKATAIGCGSMGPREAVVGLKAPSGGGEADGGVGGTGSRKRRRGGPCAPGCLEVKGGALEADDLTAEVEAAQPAPSIGSRLAVGISRGATVATDGSVVLSWARQVRQTAGTRPKSAATRGGGSVRQVADRSVPEDRCATASGSSDSLDGAASDTLPLSAIALAISQTSDTTSICSTAAATPGRSPPVGSPPVGSSPTGLGDPPSASLSRPSDRVYLGLAVAEMGRRAMFRAQGGLVLRMERRVFEVPSCNGLLPGKVMLQALPSIVAAQVLAPRPGSRLIDMCAAPGGKTTLLAALMDNRGRVVALDRTAAKVQEILSLARDFGATCVEAYKADSTEAVAQAAAGPVVTTATRDAAPAPAPAPTAAAAAAAGPDKPSGKQSTQAALGPPPYAPGSFDFVLLDPPCSALGLRPRLLHSWTLPQLRAMAAYQRSLMHTAVQLLAPGGEMVYCTCTINPDENEANVAWALDRFVGQMELLPAEPLLGLPGLVGVDPLSGDRWLTPEEAPLVQRFDPGLLLPGRKSGPYPPDTSGARGNGASAAAAADQDSGLLRAQGPPGHLGNGSPGSAAAGVSGPGTGDLIRNLTGAVVPASSDEWPGDEVMGFFIARFRKVA